MAAGELDRRITIQQCVQDQDDSGEPRESYQDLVTVWAEFLPAGGSESFQEGRRVATQGCQFRIRSRSGITPQMRVMYRGKPYEIEDVSEPDRNRYVVLSCRVLENESGTRS